MLLLRAPADQRFSVAIANRERPAQSARLHLPVARTQGERREQIHHVSNDQSHSVEQRCDDQRERDTHQRRGKHA